MHSTSDAVISAVLKFIKVFLKVVGQFAEFVATLSSAIPSAIPSSVYLLRKGANHHATFTKFVVCTYCNKLYHFVDCIDNSGGHQSSNTCTFVHYPHHPHLNKRAPCGSILLKTVTLSSGVKVLYPMKMYPYKTLFSSLRDLLLRPGFADSCQQ